MIGRSIRGPDPHHRAVGVLGLQGDVREHVEVLEGLGATVVVVRRPSDLESVCGIVLPGGESTTLSMLLESAELFEPLRMRLSNGMPAFGTCAGMILLATTVLDGRKDQRCLGAIDICVRRNAFGRQVDSFEEDLEVHGISDGPMHAIFIRAPIVEAVGETVEVLASTTLRDGRVQPVVCRQETVMVASFHPELSHDTRLHERFLRDAWDQS